MAKVNHSAEPVGKIVPYIGGTVTDGHLLCNGGTIGSAASGATSLASAYAVDLFTLIWNSVSNTNAPIQDSAGSATTRGANAAADFAANKRLPLPDSRGRALIGTGTGSGLTARSVGDKVGEETHQLSVGEMPSHAHLPKNGPTSGIDGYGLKQSINILSIAGGLSSAGSFGTDTTGGDGAHNNMQPSLAVTAMIRY